MDKPDAADSLTVRLLRQGKIRAALDRAKSVHKSSPTPESEALLLRCYAMRVRELRAGGHAKEAERLEALVRSMFPEWTPGFDDAPLSQPPKSDSAPIRKDEETARPDPLDEALVRLADRTISEGERRAAEAVVAEWAFNPVTLARHPALTPEHPLQPAAQAVAEAFAAVVSRPVDEAEIALPEVSRRSPLAGWKLLIRTIAHLQRREDAQAKKALDGLAVVSSAPARLISALQDVLAGRWSGMDKVHRRVFAPWRPGERRLPFALARLDSRLLVFIPETEFEVLSVSDSRKRDKDLLAAMRSAAEAVCQEAPSLTNRFRELTTAKAVALTEIPLPEIEKALGGPVTRTASFWRLAALALENRYHEWQNPDVVPEIFFCWEAFRRHGVAEGFFPAGGREDAEIYLRLAERMMEFRTSMRENPRGPLRFDPKYCYGPEQPTAVLALAPRRGDKPIPTDPMFLFRNALERAPSGESFLKWLEAAREIERSSHWRMKKDRDDPTAAEQVLESWSQALPNDPTPWLILMDETEKRNALTLAQKHLAKAEAIDPLNADLSRAKWRLALAICRRHLKQGKAHLVEADVAKLKTLRRHGPENAGWLLAALDWLLVASMSAPSHVARHQELIAMTGTECAAGLLETGILNASNASLLPKAHPMPDPPPAGETEAAIPGIVRVFRLLAVSGFPFCWPRTSPWPKWLVKTAALLPAADLPSLAEPLLSGGHFKQAFTLTSAGLGDQGPPTSLTGRLLLLRAQVLNKGKAYQFNRVNQCLRAAAEIGRRTNDNALVSMVAGLLESQNARLAYRFFDDDLKPMRDEELTKVIRIERENPAFPNGRTVDPHGYPNYLADFVFDDDPELCECPDCRRDRDEPPPRGAEYSDGFDVADLFDEAFKAYLPEYTKETESILRDTGLSRKSSRRLGAIVAPFLIEAMLIDGTIGAGFFDFVSMNPELREKIMAAMADLPPEDRVNFENIDERAAAERMLTSKRGKQKRRGRR